MNSSKALVITTTKSRHEFGPKCLSLISNRCKMAHAIEHLCAELRNVEVKVEALPRLCPRSVVTCAC